MTNTASPAVTVLMAVHNGTPYVGRALQSIVGQSYSDFELLVIDDASTDSTRATLDDLGDARLRVVPNEERLGLTRSLRRGVDLARGSYVARIDSDDAAHPERLTRQVAFLDAHPDVGIVGSSIRIIDAEGRAQGVRAMPRSDLEIRWTSLFTSPFAHPSVMFRRDLLRETGCSYDPQFEVAQDYDLWTRLLPHTKGANLPQPLLDYRRHEDQVCHQRWVDTHGNQDRVALRTIAEQFPDLQLDGDRLRTLRAITSHDYREQVGETFRYVEAVNLYVRLLDAFRARHPRTRELMRLLRREAVALGWAMLRAPGERGWFKTMGRLAFRHPLLPVVLAGRAALRLPGALWRRLRGRSGGKR